MHAARLVASLALATLVASGCIGAGDPAEGEPPTPPKSYLGLGHPYPEGDEWPQAGGQPLAGPFEGLAPERVTVIASDGTELNVWVVRPGLPDGVGAPVVVWASPYWGTTMQAGDDPALWDNSEVGEAVPVDLLVENGYAVAIMNLRGSGLSGGCFQLFGSKDWDDTAAVVEWAGREPWSNGRVGAMGLSYHGTTPWQAAVRNPPHLKTIVTAGMINNLYTFFHTPQGAGLFIGPAFSTELTALVATGAPFEPLQRMAQDWTARIPERACPEVAQVLTETYRSDYVDQRDEGFWEDRRIIRDMPGLTASVLATQGLRDLFGSGHAQEEDPVWGVLPEDTPKRMVLGQWEHMFPNFSDSWTGTRDDWHESVVLPWLDFWLKGIGDEPPGLGQVEYQDDGLDWHTSTSWPPAEARLEALNLCAGKLDAEPCTGGQGSFLSVPSALANREFACGSQFPLAGPAYDPVRGKTSLLFVSDPLEADALLAGNPVALLNLESDQPGGLVTLYLYEVAGDGTCGQGFREMGFGAADLRHHAGNYVGVDFPTGTSTAVRVEVTNMAEAVAKGNRIALAVANSEIGHFASVPWSPTITVHGGSHILLPLVEGTLGGGPPPLSEYPPRPFVPAAG